MCRLVRCTIRRAAPCRMMRTRVLAARRSLESLFSIYVSAALLLLRLFDDDLLVGVTLALVRLGRLVRTHLGSDLADLLPVRALDEDLGLRRCLRLHALGERVDDR